MFEKFTDRARKVMSLAQGEAKSLGKQYVGTEHILLALLRESEGIAAQALNKLDVTYNETLATIREISHDDSMASVSGGHIPFTPRAKRVLESAYRETMTRGTNFISTEHLLLGIVSEADSRAMVALSRMGVSSDGIRAAVDDLLESTGETDPDPIEDAFVNAIPRGMSNNSSRGDKTNLQQYGKNLTKLASEDKLDPVIGRDREIDRVMQVLARRQKNNPLILGDPGVGKTAVVEGLARLVAKGEVPDLLRNKEIWTLDVSSLVAGAKYRGEFEDRLKQVIAEVMNSNDIILFIDEVHTIIGAGSAEGSLDAASILKPPLSRGEIQVIGATTAEEYRKHIEKDSALERRFQPVNVGEPSPKDSLQILHGLRERYEKHHHVRYTDAALEAAVILSNRYIQDRFLPDKAIDVLDEAGARTRVHKVALPPELKAVDEELAQVKADKTVAASAQEFEEAARLRDREKELTRKREELEAQWHKSMAASIVEVDDQAIADIVSDMSGVPVSNLTEAESSKLLRAEEALHGRVIGQSDAVSRVARAIRRSRSPLKDPRRPGGSFIFLGPSGVGKTELAKSLAEFLFGSDDAMIRFDMSEFMEKHSISKLLGAPPGYVGYDEGGELTKAVRRRPYSVVLFDEMEKAHPDVFNVLLQVLDDGRLTDGQGRVVDFSNTVIIMTSNIGAREIARTTPMGFSSQGNSGLSDKEIKSRVEGELKRVFRPEFLNRVDEIVVFQSLSKEDLRKIVELMAKDLRNRLILQGMSLELSDAAADYVAKEGTDPVYGARPLRRAIQTLIEDRLAEELLQGLWKPGEIVFVDADESGLVFTHKEGEIPQLEARLSSALGESLGARDSAAPATPRLTGGSGSLDASAE